jgi:hypothetical protein
VGEEEDFRPSVEAKQFMPSAEFAGAREGYVYTSGKHGQGYYPERVEGQEKKHKFPDGTTYGAEGGAEGGAPSLNHGATGWTPQESKPKPAQEESMQQVQQVPDAATLSAMPTERRNAFVKDKYGDVWEVCETNSATADEVQSPSSGEPILPGMRFYFCHRTGHTRWDQPPGLVLPPVTMFPHPVVRGRRPSQIQGDVEWAI